MTTSPRLLAILLAGLAIPAAVLVDVAASAAAPAAAAAADETPHYDADGRLLFPSDYREWIFLSSGIDMSYNNIGEGHSMFGNAFVNHDAYHAFTRDGHWPDKTMLLVEFRGATSQGSINKKGKYQDDDMMAVEAHVHDTSRFKDGWGFFVFNNDKPATMIPTSAECYSCHKQHGAVDTTFVQFYPTLMEVAKQKGTLSENYRHDEEAGH
ncbi:MAG TPA: cytochrome P460 family protein [Rudaea sp.]|nr:cytochrome P460 family protein [Rudaea sp.]